MASARGNQGLAVVAPGRSGEELEQAAVWFCGHCGARSEPDGAEFTTRVCRSCNLGLLLQADAGVAPEPGAAFMVLDSAMSICGLSKRAEKLLATTETAAVNHHVTELVVPADAEAHAPANLAVAVTWAARGDPTARKVVVRPSRTFGVRLKARIASCGPPRAALLVFD